jgi:hypothetical protein
MVMPGAWATARRGRAELAVVGAFGHAVGADDHHMHHAGPAVSVNPMSPVELAATTRAGVWLTRSVAPRVGGSLALPIDSDAETRASISLGVGWRWAAWQLGADVDVPLAGDAFDVRGSAQLVRRL